VRPLRVIIEQLTRYVALEIDVDFNTGARAGDVDPRDRNLACPGWQNIDLGKEIRLIINEAVIDEYIDRYTGVPGITILEGKDTINARVLTLVPTRYAVVVPPLLETSITIKRIRIDDIPPETPPNEQVRIVYERGGLGIRKIEPYLIP